MEKGVKRVRSPSWSYEETKVLVDCKKEAFLNGEEGGHVWRQIADNLSRTLGHKYQVRTPVQCQRRWDTLKKVYNHIEYYCIQTGQYHWELDDDELESMELPTAYQEDWYSIVKEVCSKQKRKYGDEYKIQEQSSKGTDNHSLPTLISQCALGSDAWHASTISSSISGQLASLPPSENPYVVETLEAHHQNLTVVDSESPACPIVKVRNVPFQEEVERLTRPREEAENIAALNNQQHGEVERSTRPRVEDENIAALINQLQGEVERLKRKNNALMLEMEHLRQKHSGQEDVEVFETLSENNQRISSGDSKISTRPSEEAEDIQLQRECGSLITKNSSLMLEVECLDQRKQIAQEDIQVDMHSWTEAHTEVSHSFEIPPGEHDSTSECANSGSNSQKFASSLRTSSDSRQPFHNKPIPTLETSCSRQEHQEGRVHQQLSNHQMESRLSPWINARTGNLQQRSPGGKSLLTMNTMPNYMNQNDLTKYYFRNVAMEDLTLGRPQGQVAIDQIRTIEHQLGGRSLQTSSVSVRQQPDSCTPPSLKSTLDEHACPVDKVLVQRT